MKKQAWTGVIAATVCTFAIGLSAQTPPQTSPTSRQSSSSASDRITVTGCVQKDTASATAGTTGTSGSTSSSASTTNFVLNVTPSSSGAAASSSTSSTSATAGTSGTASSYKLDADDAKLSPHVGHKVEITGTLDKSMSSSTAPSGSTSTSSSSSPKLKVDSVRMIAASCSN